MSHGALTAPGAAFDPASLTNLLTIGLSADSLPLHRGVVEGLLQAVRALNTPDKRASGRRAGGGRGGGGATAPTKPPP